MSKSKLKNVETVRKMTEGTSRWQRRTVMGFTDINSVKEKAKSRAEGEIWEEQDGELKKWCRMENGTKVRYSVHPSISDQLKEMREFATSYWNCPKEVCTCTRPKAIDEKFRKKTGMCEDCVITMETRLKIQGKFKPYALEKMKSNAQAFFKNADQEVEDMKKQIQSGISFVDENGDIEVWTSENAPNLLSKVDESYGQFKQSTLEKFSMEENGS